MDTTKENLRQRLLDEKKKLLEEIDELQFIHADGLGTTTEFEYYGNHDANVGTETFEHEKGLALEWNLRRQLQETEDALRRMDEVATDLRQLRRGDPRTAGGSAPGNLMHQV